MAKKKSTATRRQESQAASARAAAIRQAQERKERRRRSLRVTGAGVVVLALVVVIFTVYRGSQDDGGTGTSAAPAGAGTGYSVPVGSATAPTTVTIYEDFLCPYCGQLEAATRAKLQAGIDAGNVRVRYHVLNFLGPSSTTEYSLRSANALAVVLDASGSKVAKKFHDLLYENQPKEGSAGLSDGQLLDYAVEAGATRSAVSPGISDQTYQAWVERGTDQASKDGVNATPTVKIDGKAVEGGSIAEIAAEVDRAAAGG
jgi:protein-disulfide isomerase